MAEDGAVATLEKPEIVEKISKKREKKSRPKRRKLRKAELLLLLLPAVAVVVFALVTNYLERDLNSYTFETQGVQYYLGNTYIIDAGTVYYRNQEENTVLRTSQAEYNAFDIPVYFQGEDRLMVPENMTLVNPRDHQQWKLEYFTEVEVQSNGTILTTREGQTASLPKGFLYDGDDFYLFLEPVILSFNGYRIGLPAMSYVEADYTGEVMVYNYGGGEFYIELPKGDVIATIETGDYEISLLEDSITTYDGQKELLFTRPEQLDSVFD